MDKVAEFYGRWSAKKPGQEYSAAEAASEEFATASALLDELRSSALALSATIDGHLKQDWARATPE